MSHSEPHHRSRRAASPSAFEQLLAEVRGEVDPRLERRLAVLHARLAAHGVGPTAAALRDFVLRGGKRFRAALVMIGYLGVDVRAARGPAFDAGAAFELLHAYLLVQDDWMDGDATRRGGPTVHAALARRYRDPALGPTSAILASDFACGMAFELLSSAKVPAEHALRAVREMLAAHEDVLLGQQLDLRPRSRAGASDVERMHELKTASYTVRGPLLVGAALAGAGEATMRALGRFASPLGIAFQLRDDLLGVFASEDYTGKPLANDLRAGKRTAVTVLARGLMRTRGSDAYAQAFGNAGASRAELLRAARWLEACGIRRRVEERLRELCAEATRLTRRLPLAPCARTWLHGATAMLLEPVPPFASAAPSARRPGNRRPRAS